MNRSFLAGERHSLSRVASTSDGRLGTRGRCRVVTQARAARYDRRRPPPPDLPSLLFDQRIVYIGMPLVPAVTELIVAELMYLEKQGATLPIEMMINSSGTTRQDGEILAFDSEGIALTSTMGFIKNPISTVNMGLAVGWSAVLLASGKKGWRKSLPHSLAVLQQPRVPPTGTRQAIEVHIKWREVLDYKRELLRMLSIATGWPVEKLDLDMQRPLYMRPRDAMEYGIIDEVIPPNAAKAAKAQKYWLKTGRAESEGRLEQWAEYLGLQEEALMRDSFKKVMAQNVRESFRDASEKLLGNSEKLREETRTMREVLPPQLITDDDKVRLPFNEVGLRMATLNAERYARRNVERQVKAGRVKVPAAWEQDIARSSADHTSTAIDYEALLARIESMDETEFAGLDVDELVSSHMSSKEPAGV